MQQYPKWIYHDTLPARIVQDVAEHAAAGPEWRETPNKPEPVAPEPEGWVIPAGVVPTGDVKPEPDPEPAEPEPEPEPAPVKRGRGRPRKE